MKGDIQGSHGERNQHLYRLVNSLCLSIIILSEWDQLNHSIFALLLLICLIIYQFLIFFIETSFAKSLSNTVLKIVRFSDAVFIGIFIALISYDIILSIGIIFSLIIAYLALPIRSNSLTLLGLVTGGLSALIFSLPTVVLSDYLRAFILLIIMSYMVIFSILNNRLNSDLSSKYQLLSTLNADLKIRIFRLSKYLSPTLRKGVLAGNDVRVNAQEKNLTVFFSDMQGFSKMSEALNPEQLAWVINSYLTEMSEIAFRFGGTLDKVIGDSLMVFFGDPESRGEQNDAVACVCMALAMRETMETLKNRWIASGMSNPPSLRMGIHSGMCKVGNFGTENRLEYTALGKAVNLASHLEAAANANEIVISQSTYTLVKHLVHCIPREPIKMKGFSNPLPAYTAIKITENTHLITNAVSQN